MVNTRSQVKAAVAGRSQSVQDLSSTAVSRETAGVERAASSSRIDNAPTDSPAASLVTVCPADGGLSAEHREPSLSGSMYSLSSVRSCSTSASLRALKADLRWKKEQLRADIDRIRLEQLQVKESAANRGLELLAEEEAEIEAEIETSSVCSSRSSRSKSVSKQLQTPSPRAASRPAIAAQISPSSCSPVVAQQSPTTSPQAAESDIQRLARALDGMQNERSSELPPFTGQPSDWLLFKMSFEEMKCSGVSKFKITKNIRKSLSGPAREAVEALLFACADPEEIVQSLENQFGRPKLIVEQQLSKLHTVKMSENDTTEFAKLAATVKNIVVTLSSLKLEKYLHSTDIFASIINKLTFLQKSKYIDFADSQSAALQEPELITISRFLQRESAKLFKHADVVDCPGILSVTSEANQRAKRAFVKSAYVVNSSANESSRRGGSKCGCATMHASIAECKQFLDKSVLERWATVIERKLCFRCLSNTHLRPKCSATATYGENGCSRPHHPLLHRVVDEDEEQVMNVHTGNVALLKVLPVTIRGPKGWVQVYALLDDGASVSLMDKTVAEAIGVDGVIGNLNITGINSFSSVPSMAVFCGISGVSQDAVEYPLRARTVPQLSISPQSVSREVLSHEHLRGLALQSYENVRPGLLIGQDNVGLLLPNECVQGGEGEPVATRTLLGWVLHGCHRGVTSAGGYSHFVGHVASTANDELNELVRKSFALDALGVSQTPRVSAADQRAISMVEKTACQNEEGRWEAGLPWKLDDFVMPDNRGEALRRLAYIQRRGKKDPDFLAAYAAQIENLVEQGYAEECPDAGISGKKWYLPHFPVINPNKPGKVRLVFDAASKSGGGSLNDMLLTGPNLLVSLLGVLFRFRQGPVAVTADIKEMFLRFLVREKDRDYLRFLWSPLARRGECGETESAPGSDVKEFRMRSVIFGAASSPFMAIYLKNKNAESIKTEHPRAYKTIVDHYMDDLVNSFDTISEASAVVAKVAEVHRKGGMELRAWASNAPEVIAQFPSELHAPGPVALGDDSGEAATIHKILGVMWHPNEDTLGFNTAMPRLDTTVLQGESRPTKRQLLVAIASMYDPLGLVSPFTICGKILLQDVWRAGTGWDERLNDEQSRKFQEWISRLSHYGRLSIPRCYALDGFAGILELHTFCDASELAFSAACYWRIISSNHIHCTLIVAKARVAPLRPVSIPRMELQAAVLGARLADTVVREHDMKPVRQVFWSDSATVLAWIRSDARSYKAYVANRLGEIDELTGPGRWRWVPTKQNPADLATRDQSAVVEGGSEWFDGPGFLYGDESTWPHLPPGSAALPREEIKELVLTTCKDTRSLPLPTVDRISNWAVLINATANILLFIEKLRNRKSKMSITIKQKAERLWVQQVQRECYPVEYECLRAGCPIPSNSSLLEATPYLDEHGLMRVRGRIDAASSAIPLSVKRPIILGKHQYTDLLLTYYHKKYLHGSTETVLNEIRQLYWIPRLRSRLRYVSHRCVMCRVRRARPLSPPVGDLPLERLDFAKRPFTHCGVDYFGPISVTIGRRKEKRWICLFTCLVCRAVHLEIADSLTSDSALLALRRFMARRGSPATVFSDNGTNFRAADKELRAAWAELDKAELERQALSHNIVWKFIPAAAPHMGGAWERLVQAVKRTLSATIKERAPKPEVLHTLLAEAEAMVNSRPLSRVSTDPNDEEALTPNHFLLGSSSGRYTTPGVFDDTDLCSRRDWRVTQRLADHFWARWTKECLPLMRGREKNTVGAFTDLKEGEVVIIADQRLPRNCWPLGRVAAVYPGRDGRVRVVDVRTAQGTYRRPTKMVAPLRLEN